jgi:hypothetical protein
LERGNEQERELSQRLWEFRQNLISELNRRFQLQLIGGASAHKESDADEQSTGITAGERFILAERWLESNIGPRWAPMLRMGLFTEARRQIMYREILHLLGSEGRRRLLSDLSRETEVYVLARIMHYSEKVPWAVQFTINLAQLLGLDDSVIQRARYLSTISDDMRRNMRNDLLLEIDGLMSRYSIATTDETRIELARRISLLQIKANFFIPEAYIGGGSAARFAQTGGYFMEDPLVRAHEAYQAALSQLPEIFHIIDEADGNITDALRQYELFKYINRFGISTRAVGVTSRQLQGFENLGAYLYRTNREAHQELQREFWFDILRQHKRALEHGAPVPTDPQTRGRRPVSPQTLEALEVLFFRFLERANEALVIMRRRTGL